MNRITVYDVINLIETMKGFKESDFIISEVQQVINLYPEERKKDPSASQDLIIENILYNIINNRKND